MCTHRIKCERRTEVFFIYSLQQSLGLSVWTVQDQNPFTCRRVSHMTLTRFKKKQTNCGGTWCLHLKLIDISRLREWSQKVYLVQVWPSPHDSGPVSVCLRSRSFLPRQRICLAPPATKASMLISNILSWSEWSLGQQAGITERVMFADLAWRSKWMNVVWDVRSLDEHEAFLPWWQPSSCGTSHPASWWWLWPRCWAAASNLSWLTAASSFSSPPSEQKRVTAAAFRAGTNANTLRKQNTFYLHDLLQSRFPLLVWPGVRTGGRIFPLGGCCCCFQSTCTQGRASRRHKQSDNII